jgi:hypothetical protein
VLLVDESVELESVSVRFSTTSLFSSTLEVASSLTFAWIVIKGKPKSREIMTSAVIFFCIVVCMIC